MKATIRIACMIICAGLAACCTAPTGKSLDSGASGSQKSAQTDAPIFPKLDIWLAENKLAINAGQSRVVEYGKAFSQGAVLAYGEGYPMAGADGAGQKRLTAVRAAEVTAQRNLAEYFSRYATNGEIRFNSYNAHLEAFLQGAHVAVSEYNVDLGKAAVILRLDLGGAKGFAR